MNIDRTRANGFEVLKIKDNLGPRADLEDLRRAVKTLLAEGKAKIAVSFTPASYLDSRAIGNLAKCIEMVRVRNGKLAIVQPNSEIADFLRIVGFVKHVGIYTTEAEIGLE